MVFGKKVRVEGDTQGAALESCTMFLEPMSDDEIVDDTINGALDGQIVDKQAIPL